ncbi:MAG: right-handed parallel beta-helix repeat-containing protein, partial [Saprospiraceae bacterium]
MTLKSTLFAISIVATSFVFYKYFTMRSSHFGLSVNSSEEELFFLPAPDTLYREVFPFLSDSSNAGGRAIVQGWKGFRNGATSNSLQIFYASIPPAHKTAINSNPTGQIDTSIAFWSPSGVSGVSMFTDEFGNLNCPSTNLAEIRWQTNSSNQGSGTNYTPLDGNSTSGKTRALIKVNGIYYASFDSVNIANSPDAATYLTYSINLATTQWGRLCLGGTDCVNGDASNAMGPRKINSIFYPLVNLPVGNVESIGLFIDFFTGKYRMGNFEVLGYKPPTKLYVDSSVVVNGDGHSWGTAIKNLQDALYLTSLGKVDTICVAKGTYYPAVTGRDSSFNIPDSVVMLGGFPTGGMGERNWQCNKTILSGDVDNDGTFANNSYHVVTTNAVGTQTVVDGFCITGGYADNTGGNGFLRYGAGWLNRGITGVESSPNIRNCVFTDNQTGIDDSGNFGGAAFASFADDGSTNPTLINCIFNNNKSLKGGAIRVESTGSYTCNWTLINCILSGNVATSSIVNSNERGGGIYNSGQNTMLQMINCVLSGNHVTAFRQGGGLYNNNFSSSNPVANLVNCIVWNNSTASGNYTYFNLGAAAINLSYSIIGPASIVYPGTGVPGTGTFTDVTGNKIGVDPLFLSALDGSAAPTSLGDFHVMPGSPAIDMGLSSANTYPTDLDGGQRIQGDIIDIGAYEFGSYFAAFSKHIICDSGDTRIFYGLNTPVGDSCKFHLIVSGPTTKYSEISFLVGGLANTGINSFSLDSVLNVLDGGRIAEGTFTLSFYKDCKNSFCSDTIRDTLIVTPPPIIDLYFDHEIMCVGGDNLLHFKLLNDIDTGYSYDLKWKRGIDSGYVFTDQFIQENTTYSYSSSSLVTGGLIQGDYKFTLSLTDTTLCPGVSKTINLRVGTISKLYVDSSAIVYDEVLGIDFFVYGESWSFPMKNLQEALLIASAGCIDTICVAKGTYYPAVSVRDSSFNIPDSVVMLGGFPTGGMGERNWVCNKTILCGDINQNGGPGGNSYHVVTTYSVSAATIVDGFCISGGNANTMALDDNRYGGGWFNRGLAGDSSNPTIINCVFTDNRTATGTTGNNNGGGMANYGDEGSTNPTLINCIFNDNRARRGGAMYNYADNGFQSSPRITNCIFSGNRAVFYGGGMVNDAGTNGISATAIVNTVISGNSAGTNGGAMHIDGDGSTPTLTNCIVWNNSNSVFSTFSNQPAINYSIIQASASGTYNDGGNNKPDGTDPLFVNAPGPGPAPTAAGNFHFSNFSPAIDMGDDGAIIAALAGYKLVDLDDTTRIINKVDIGPYELQTPNCSNYLGITTIYVDSSATGGNNGLSWDSAFTDLQDALLVAKICGIDSILVALGTYYPSDTTIYYDACGVPTDTVYPDQSISFNIPDSTVVLGGYLPGGSITRDWLCNKTILCGDIDKDGTLTGNSYHVLYTAGVDSATVIDGFCISGGNANGPGGVNQSGGGWYNGIPGDTTSPIVRNCSIYGNYAELRGGGVFLFGRDGEANPQIINCLIFENESELRGGGIFALGDLDGNASPFILNTIISGNRAGTNGGGIFFGGEMNGQVFSRVINSIISGNYAEIRGGGIYNRGQDGGNASPVLINTVIAGNFAEGDGGAVFNDVNPDGGLSEPDFVNCIFWNNEAGDNGNVFFNNNGTAKPNASYTIFQGGPDINDASITQGSGISVDNGNNKFQIDGTDPKFVNSPLASSAPTTGGNFHVMAGSPAIDMGSDAANAYPTDLDGNPRIQGASIDIGAYEYQSGFICDDYAGLTTIYVDSTATGGNNGFDWDSAFTDLQDALAVARICGIDTIKVAQGTYYPSYADTIFNQCDPSMFTIIPADSTVSFDIPDSAVVLGGYLPGGSEDRDPACNKTILCGDIQQDGIQENNSYHVVTTFGVSDATVVDGFCITGGYAVYDFTQNNDFPTLRNVGGGWLNVPFAIQPSDDMAIPSSKPRILNCIFTDNNGLIGAGLANLGIFGYASPYLENCNFSSDSAILGGGIANLGYDGESSPKIIDCKFQGNTGIAAGGILNLSGSIIGISGNRSINPKAGSLRSKSAMPQEIKEAIDQSGLMSILSGMSHHMPGTGISIPGTAALPAQIPGFGVTNPEIVNTLITGNAAIAGGGIVNYVLNFTQGGGGESSPKIINTTIASNTGLAIGGGMINGDEGPVDDGNNILKACIVNCILFDNRAGDVSTNDMFIIVNGNNDDTIKMHHSISETDYATLVINCSNCIDTSLGGNKYQVNPLFVNAMPGDGTSFVSGDYHVQQLSPAINMGDNVTITAALTGLDFIDLDGVARIAFSIVDIGAYEMLLNCDQDTLYVMASGGVPSLPIDSLIDPSAIGPNCQLIVNDLVNPTEIPFDCSNLGLNTLKISVVKTNCDVPDTLYMCDKIVVVIDTFPKSLISQNSINVSLDQNCMKVLTPYDVLVGLKGCDNNFDIEISYPAGTNTYPEGDKLDRSHLGYCMVFSVIEVNTGNRSWGKLCVEDKAPPMIECKDDTVTCFDIAHLPQDGYEVNDNCGNPVKVKVAEESFEDYGCNGDPLLLGVVTRRLIATDQWGNSIDCTRKLYIAKTSLDSVLCPRDTSVDCSIAIIPVTLKDKSIILVPITDPSRSHAPQVKTMNGLVDIWPNNPSCKLTVHYTDEKVIICGGGYKVRRDWLITDWCTGIEKHCYQWIVVEDKTAPIARDTTLPVVYSDPHDCGRYVDIDTLPVMDCSRVKQNYSIRYSEEGGNRIIEGVLPVKHIWLPTGVDTIRVFLVDACFNTSKAFIRIPIVDNTPPTPVCDEFTQVTVDPEGCWSKVAAKDLDNGSRDNCCSVLHFAAAKMDSIEYWRNYWNTKLEAAAGKTDFWKYKAEYDEVIEDWINCYVFSDTVHFDECGSNQVVLRVYEACGVPRYDPHVFPCSEHAWFCYNTYNYIGDFNYNWFDAKGAKACSYRPPLTTLERLDSIYTSNYNKGYFEPKYIGAAQYEFCKVPFYFPHLLTACDYIGNVRKNGTGEYCSERLYADCMVNVLVDDKQAPVVADLDDITIYCDGAPDWADHPRDCDNGYKDGKWPGELKDSKGNVYGYYGGSDFLGIHPNGNDHDDPQACASAQGWAPIYCRQWLLLDSTDQPGHVDYKSYFDHLVLFDKDSVQNGALKSNQFSITDNCKLDKTSLIITEAGTINGCGEGWISRTWTIKDKCGNPVSATQKIYVKHRSDFEVIFPEDKIVTCDFLNRTDTS